MKRHLLFGLAALVTGVRPPAAHAAAPDPHAYTWELTSEEDSIPPDVDRRFSLAWKLCQEAAVTTRDNVRCYSLEFNRQDKVLSRT